MKCDLIIDSASCAGKIAIEKTNLHPIAKASINLGIDIAAECLKNELSADTEKICNAAEQFGIDKVVAIPIVSCNGQNIVVIRAYGHNAEIFIRHLGLNIISENEKNSFVRDIHETENRYSILIYEKN